MACDPIITIFPSSTTATATITTITIIITTTIIIIIIIIIHLYYKIPMTLALSKRIQNSRSLSMELHTARGEALSLTDRSIN